jgi:hypothetical protein
MDVGASLFKPVEGGYVFRVPYQLGLGKVRHYLVNESEKATLIAAIVGERPARRRNYLWLAGTAALIVAVSVVLALSPHREPAVSNTIAILVLSFALILVEAAAWRFWKLRQLAPMLARLVPTELTITRAEMRRATFARNATSHVWFGTILYGVVGAVGLASSAYLIWSGRHSPFAMVFGLIFTGMAINYALHLVSRLRDEHATQDVNGAAGG